MNLNAIQRRWVYLEPIFGRGALPREEARFKRVDEDFRYRMSICGCITSDLKLWNLFNRTNVFYLHSVTKRVLFMSNRSIMSDIQRDNRVVSLSSRAGIRNSLVTILDQLQRCQKSLNEFLEVHKHAFLCAMNTYSMYYMECKHHNLLFVCACVAGEALCLPTLLFHRR